MTIIVGIDPGAKGGLAVLINGKLVSWLKMPLVGKRKDKFQFPEEGDIDIAKILDWLDVTVPKQGDRFFAGEKVNGIRGQSASASFNFGVSTAMVYSALLAHGRSPGEPLPDFEIYHKLRWGPGVGIPTGSDKKASVNLALELWPRAGELGQGKFTDGPAEAALIGYFAHIKKTKGI